MFKLSEESKNILVTPWSFSEKISFGRVSKLIFSSTTPMNMDGTVEIIMKTRTGTVQIVPEICIGDFIDMTRQKHGINVNDTSNFEIDLGSISLLDKELIIKVENGLTANGTITILNVQDTNETVSYIKQYHKDNDDVIAKNVCELYVPAEDIDYEIQYPDNTKNLVNGLNLKALQKIYSAANYALNGCVLVAATDNGLPIISGLKVSGATTKNIIYVSYIYGEDSFELKRSSVSMLVAQRQVAEKIDARNFGRYRALNRIN